MESAPLPHNEAERLRRLQELAILDTLGEQAYNDIVRLAAQICDTPIALVSLVDSERQWFKARHGLDAAETPRDVAFCAHAILDDQLFIVEDACEDPRFHDNPLVTGGPHVRFYAGAPLVMGNDLRLGTLCVIDSKPGSISAAQQESLAALARQVVNQFELRMKIRELEGLDKAKDEFISTVSHELRTPLTSINGSLTLLCNKAAGALNEKQHSMVDIAARNSKRLLCIVNDILDLAKLEAGKLEIDCRPHRLGGLIKNAIALNRPYCAQCKCDVVFKGEGTDTDQVVLCDDARLIQVLTNLITNAAKFTPDNGVVVVDLATHGNSVRIGVTDFGPGIPEDQQGHIFERFKQVSSSVNSKMPGTGLGLRISKQIVGLHGGSIGFESVPGEHTTFYFTLPLPGQGESSDAA